MIVAESGGGGKLDLAVRGIVRLKVVSESVGTLSFANLFHPQYNSSATGMVWLFLVSH